MNELQTASRGRTSTGKARASFAARFSSRSWSSCRRASLSVVSWAQLFREAVHATSHLALHHPQLPLGFAGDGVEVRLCRIAWLFLRGWRWCALEVPRGSLAFGCSQCRDMSPCVIFKP